MGQKVNPIGLRLGINRTWRSRWFVDPRDYADALHEDLALRRAIEDSPETKSADIAEVEIVRHPQRITVIIHTARPGVLIGAKGSNIEKLGGHLQRLVGKKIKLNIKEVIRPETHATLVAKNVARQLKARGSFRRAMTMAINNSMKTGIQGIKVNVAGRLGGSEMSRSEQMMKGRVPLHTFRADIEYGFAEANTTFGTIGVKVWIFHGEKFGREPREDIGALTRRRERPERGERAGPGRS
jgi:small subunit ribosomal protein S3